MRSCHSTVKNPRAVRSSSIRIRQSYANYIYKDCTNHHGRHIYGCIKNLKEPVLMFRGWCLSYSGYWTQSVW